MTISVTGCSTWRRVFISRKKKLAVLVEELDGAGVDVAAALGHLHRGLAHRRQISSGMSGAGLSSISFW